MPPHGSRPSEFTPVVIVTSSGANSATNTNTANAANTANTANTATPTEPATPENRITPAVPDTSEYLDIPETLATLGSEVPLANRVLAPSAARKYNSATFPAGRGTKRESIFGQYPRPSTMHPRVSVDSVYFPSEGNEVEDAAGISASNGLADESIERDPGVGSSSQGNDILQDIETHTRKLRESIEAAAQQSATQSATQSVTQSSLHNGQIVVPVGLLSPFVVQQPLQQGVAPPHASTCPVIHRFATLQEVASSQTGKVSDKETINPFTTRSFINQTDTRLLSLPDKALIPVMTFLPPHDLIKLRHVSREFLRLFDRCDKFKKYHDNSRSTVWAAPDPSLYFSGQSVDKLLPLCKHCRALRGNDPLGRSLLSSLPLLYCSRCKMKHRSMHFSQRQRNIENDQERVCLGHEGAICIDKVLFVSWTQAVSASRNPTLNQIHYSPAIEQANSHLNCRFKPITEIQFDRLDGNNIEMRVSKVFHFPFKRDTSGKVNASTFLETLESFGGKAKNFHSPLDYLCLCPTTLLRAFDPNVCDCLDWEDNEKRFSSWTRRSFIFERAPKPLGDGRPHLPGGYAGAHGRCMGRQHGFSSKHAMGEYEVDIFECQDKPYLLVFQAAYTTTFKNASDLGWRGNLHAFTYHLEQDSEMRGITWCNEVGCGVGQLASRNQTLPELEKRYNL